MAIEIPGVTASVVSEIPQNNNAGKKAAASSNTVLSEGSDKVSLSSDASFIGSLKSAVENAQSAPKSKIDGIKQKVSSGNYAESSKIAEGVVKSLQITNE
jgi:anti-sigma28 factor (negative regulator of flagellin synthesis)